MTQPINSNLPNNIYSFGCFPNLPPNFPESAEMPFYLYGDNVYSDSIEDYGIVIGRFYAFDHNLERWRWRYLILINHHLAINSFFSTFICWETDLKPVD
ncbi:MAG: hypothetical protein QNJ70_16110 [Xenococcaceae cyanobacterium MO_207.B15]|nr:hypothetical protein [Xenococcaceae cyanobacterium MO_207.B15]